MARKVRQMRRKGKLAPAARLGVSGRQKLPIEALRVRDRHRYGQCAQAARADGARLDGYDLAALLLDGKTVAEDETAG